MANQPGTPKHSTSQDDNESNLRLYNPYQDLQVPVQNLYKLPTSPEYLFPEESQAQRRSWGENLTYYTGIGYLAGSSAGAAKGFVSGVKSIEPTDTLKLKINRILNGSGQAGRQIGNRCGAIGLLYAGLESGMVAYRDNDDVINSVVAGLGTGALYKAAAGPRSAAVAGAIGGVLVGLAVAGKQALKRQDKWRNMCISYGQCSRKKLKASRVKTISSEALSTLTTGNLVAEADAVDDISRSPWDVRDAPGFKAMIFEALSSIRDSNGSNIDDIVGFIEQKHEVPQNIRRILSTRLRRLVLQGKLEKVQDRYKIKDAALGTKTPMPKQKDLSAETVEDAAMTAACKIADAEYKSFVAAEAVKEAERVSKMAEDADSLLLLANEIFEKCSRGETVRLAKSSYNFD